MAIKLVKFDNKTTYMYPNGEIATPERILKDFPAMAYFPHVLEVSGNVLGGVSELAAMRQMYDIDETLTDDEAILSIQTVRNAPPPAPSNEPTAEERIAAAMEFQNLMSL